MLAINQSLVVSFWSLVLGRSLLGKIKNLVILSEAKDLWMSDALTAKHTLLPASLGWTAEGGRPHTVIAG
jgi:hypothetical protein